MNDFQSQFNVYLQRQAEIRINIIVYSLHITVKNKISYLQIWVFISKSAGMWNRTILLREEDYLPKEVY